MPEKVSPSVVALFEPFGVRGLICRNRLVMAPMTRCFSPSGVPGEDVAQYYRRRAEGNVGLLFTEGIGVDHPAAIGDAGLGERDLPLLHGSDALAGWKRVVDEVHAAGGKIIPQLWHQGPLRAEGGTDPQVRSARPSGVWGPAGRRTALPRRHVKRMLDPIEPMTTRDIDEVVAGFVRSAENAVRLGFDGLAIHGAHGYLIDSFLWPETNQRTDRYGGDVLGRTALAGEIVRAMREVAGDQLPVVFRWSQWKLQDLEAQLASDPAQLEALLTPLVDAGVDIFDVSTRTFDKPAFEGSGLSLAGWTKKVTGCPTICVGGVGLAKELYDSFQNGSEGADNVAAAAALVSTGECDLVAAGRALLVDPNWLHKISTGEPFVPWHNEARNELV